MTNEHHLMPVPVHINNRRPTITDHKLRMLHVSLTSITVDVLTLGGEKKRFNWIVGGNIHYTEYRGVARRMEKEPTAF